jgi:hypothetical protein
VRFEKTARLGLRCYPAFFVGEVVKGGFAEGGVEVTVFCKLRTARWKIVILSLSRGAFPPLVETGPGHPLIRLQALSAATAEARARPVSVPVPNAGIPVSK